MVSNKKYESFDDLVRSIEEKHNIKIFKTIIGFKVEFAEDDTLKTFDIITPNIFDASIIRLAGNIKDMLLWFYHNSEIVFIKNNNESNCVVLPNKNSENFNVDTIFYPIKQDVNPKIIHILNEIILSLFFYVYLN